MIHITLTKNKNKQSMTPEEIVTDLKHNIGHCNDLYDPYKQAIEDIKQYAREMCDKQKQECYNRGMIGNLEIKTAPYPKELL